MGWKDKYKQAKSRLKSAYQPSVELTKRVISDPLEALNPVSPAKASYDVLKGTYKGLASDAMDDAEKTLPLGISAGELEKRENAAMVAEKAKLREKRKTSTGRTGTILTRRQDDMPTILGA